MQGVLILYTMQQERKGQRCSMRSTSAMKQAMKIEGSKKSRDQFRAVFLRHLKTCHIDTNEKLLVIGGSWQDAELLMCAGFKDISLSNFQLELEEDAHSNFRANVKLLAIDAEQINLPDGSFDCVFAHEVLHHCRSPHRSLCEMLRVARKHVVVLEPNDSFSMRVLTWAGFSFPYEIFSVVYHGYEGGGVRDSCIPNFIFRWSANELRKTVSSYLAEYDFLAHTYPYWDFNVDENELSMRKETRIHAITSVMGAKTFLAVLRAFQIVLNGMPILRRQGNKFFCCIEKTGGLRPWLTIGNDKVRFNLRSLTGG
jgi:ubiquinone/menaquinone biosynthesis C-methylase UbiE